MSSTAGTVDGGSALEKLNRRRYLRLSPWVGLVLVGLVLVVGYPLFTSDRYQPDAAGRDANPTIVDLEFAGSDDRVDQIYADWADGTEDRIIDGLDRDNWFIATYALALLWGCLDGAVAFRSSRTRAFAYTLSAGVVIAAICDRVENWALYNVHDAQQGTGDADRDAVIALAATLPKWLILALAIPVGIAGLVRGITRHGEFRRGDQAPALEPSAATSHAAPEWERNFAIPSLPRDPEPGESRLGVCFSGGGIRSASFSLGALQELQRRNQNDDPSIFESAQYVSAVSGGGYLASAYQMLVHQSATAPNPPYLAPGSFEEDHIRRHGRYLADSVGQWAVAITRVLIGLLLNLGLVYLVLFVLSRPIGYLQRYLFWNRNVNRLVIEVPTGVWISIAVFGGLALVLVLGSILAGWATDAQVPPWMGSLWRLAAGLGALATAMVVIVVVFPLLTKLVWLTVEWVGNIGDEGNASSDDRLPGLTTIATVLGTSTAVSSFVTVRGRSKRSLAKIASKTGEFVSSASKYSGWFSRLAPKLAGVLLALIALVVLASLSHDAARRGPNAMKSNLFGVFEMLDIHLWLWAAAVLGALWLFADQTTWSLHPLYKRRLASAFAIRRDANGAGEMRYDEPTTMSEYMKPEPGQPQLVVCAAANLSGSALAPPGRRAVPFTFEHDFVGGPELGYVPTQQFQQLLGGRMKSETTLLAAAAISGAAFASAMGRHSKGAVNSLLAVFNARLGVWLPNPRVPQPASGPKLWRWFRETRRFNYLAKEIFGSYRPDDRFVYVTDGGHWENLGLVELLRRRCHFVFCFDASGGSPSFCTTLSEALLLAEEELGIEVTFPTGALEAIAPGTVPIPATGNPDRLRMLRRCALTEVAVGRIRYRDTLQTGTLVYAKAVLTDDTPAGILAHAASGRGVLFPDDGTGDQFFDQDQFGAYKELGRHIARKAVEAAQSTALGPVPTSVANAPG